MAKNSKSLRSFACMDGTTIFENDDAIYEKYGSNKLKINVLRMGQKPSKDEWFKRPSEFEAKKAVKGVKFFGNAIAYLMRAFQFIETMPNLKSVLFVFGRRKRDDFDFCCPDITVNRSVTNLEINVMLKSYREDTPDGKKKTNLTSLETLKIAFKSFPSLRNLKLFVPKLSQKDYTESFESVLEKNLPFWKRITYYKKTTKYRFNLHFEEYRISWSTKELNPEEIPKSPEYNSSMSSWSNTKTLSDEDEDITSIANLDLLFDLENKDVTRGVDENEDILTSSSIDLESILSNDLENEDLTRGIAEDEDILNRSSIDLATLLSNNLEREGVTRGIKRSSSYENMCDEDEIFGFENIETMYENPDFEFNSERSIEELVEDGACSRPQRKRKCYFPE